jgi:signal peptidase II
VVALLLLPFIAYYIYHYRHQPHFAWPLAFVAGGAVGNIIDRFRLGRVIDFVDVDFFGSGFWFFPDRWWTFNLADAAISVAIVFLLIVTLFVRQQPSPPAPISPTETAAPGSASHN